jgi:hypothetical protein
MSGGGGGGQGTDYGPIVGWVAELIPNVIANQNTDQAAPRNPYLASFNIDTVHAYNPDYYLDGMLASLNAFVATLVDFHTTGVDISAVAASALAWDASITAWNTTTAWEAFIDAANTKLTAVMLEPTYIDAEADAISAILQDDLEHVSIARFEAGMRDINAVQSSAFVIGRAMLQATKDKQVAKITADLWLEALKLKNLGVLEFGKDGLQVNLGVIKARGELTTQLMHFYTQGVEFKRSITVAVVEALRMSIVAKKEQSDKQLDIDKDAIMWYWTLLAEVDRWIASGHGGVAGSVPQSSNKIQSAIGGGMSGAAAGAMIGGAIGGGEAGSTAGPWGAAIGAAVGIGASLFS